MEPISTSFQVCWTPTCLLLQTCVKLSQATSKCRSIFLIVTLGAKTPHKLILCLFCYRVMFQRHGHSTYAELCPVDRHLDRFNRLEMISGCSALRRQEIAETSFVQKTTVNFDFLILNFNLPEFGFCDAQSAKGLYLHQLAHEHCFNTQ